MAKADRKLKKSAKRAKATADQWEIARRDSLYVIETFRLSYEPLRPDHILYDDEDVVDVEGVLLQYYSWDVGKRALDLALKTLQQIEWVSVDQPKVSDFTPSKPSPRGHIRLKRSWQIGTDGEQNARSILTKKVNELEAAVETYRSARGSFGHNRTPILDAEEDGPLPIEPIDEAIFELKKALGGHNDPELSIRIAQRKIRAWVGMWSWVKEKADRAANSIVDQAGNVVKCLVIASAIPGISATLRSCGDDVATVAKDVSVYAERWLDAASYVTD